jgi:D-sedoheptulose 7-phosphate isomerase
MEFARQFFGEAAQICAAIDVDMVDEMADRLAALRQRGGRLFLVGVGGSAGNCSHAVNDFRKLCGIEAYSPIDNVSELTARANDEGWETIFAAWLRVSHADANDALFVFSVGGGDVERNISSNIVQAVREAKVRGMTVFGVVGRASGYTKLHGDCVLVVPQVARERVTPHSEAFQAVVWHCLVSHPALQVQEAKWESAVKARAARA